MEALKSAIVECQTRRVVNLEELELEAWSVLTESGPVLDVGTVVLTPSAWQLIPGLTLLMAVDLHSCGEFGVVPEELWERNERAIETGGPVVSYWETNKSPWFVVKTEPTSSGITTTVIAVD